MTITGGPARSCRDAVNGTQPCCLAFGREEDIVCMARNRRRKGGPYCVVCQDWSIPGTTDELILPDIGDFGRAAYLAACLSGPTCRAWVEDAAGKKLFEAWPVERSA